MACPNFPVQVVRAITPGHHSKQMWLINGRAYHEFENGHVAWVTSHQRALEKYRSENEVSIEPYDEVPQCVRDVYERNDIRNYYFDMNQGGAVRAY